MAMETDYRPHKESYLETIPVSEFIEEYKKILKEPPPQDVLNDYLPTYFRGLRCFKTRQWLAAICHFSDVLKVVPHHPDALLLRGRSFVYLKDANHAIADFQRYLSFYPDDFRGYYYIGRAHNITEDYKAAIEAFTQSLERDSRNAKTLIRRGLAKHHLKQEEAAIEDVKAALKIRPFYVKAYNGCGIIHHGTESFSQAETNYEIAVQLNRFYYKAHYNRGNLQLDLHKYEQAIHWFDLAIAIKADYADAFFNRGTAKHSMFQLEEASKDYLKTIELDTRDFDAHINLGSIHLHGHHYEQAYTHFERAFELARGEKDADARSTCVRWRGQILYLLGDHPGAYRILRPYTAVLAAIKGDCTYDRELYPMEFFWALSANRCGNFEESLRVLDQARRHSRAGANRTNREKRMIERYITDGV